MLILLASKNLSMKPFMSKFEPTDMKPVFLSGFPWIPYKKSTDLEAPQVEKHCLSLSQNHEVIQLHD